MSLLHVLSVGIITDTIIQVILQDGSGRAVAIGGIGLGASALSKIKAGVCVVRNLQLKDLFLNFVG